MIYWLNLFSAVSVSIFMALLDPGFDDDENSISAICDFARDAFQR